MVSRHSHTPFGNARLISLAHLVKLVHVFAGVYVYVG